MKKIYGFIMAVLVLGAGFYACDTSALDGIPGNEAKTGDITYSASADGASGTASSTAIAFAFSGTVAGLVADDVTVTDDTGTVTKGTLNGSGTDWSLGITVVTAGNVKVAITKTGIENTVKDVAVHKAGETTPGPVAYSASANGTMGTANSTAIAFAFAEAVTGLVAEEISVTADTGAVTKGALTGNGTDWSLGITVNTAGNVKVAINKSGIENTEKNVAVHKAVTSVTLNHDHLTIAQETSETLIATVVLGNAASEAVEWTSSAPEIATVSQTGEVTGIAEGSAVITVTMTDGGLSATCDVTVPFAIAASTTDWDNAFSAISSAAGGTEDSPRVFVLHITDDFTVAGKSSGNITGTYKEVRLTGENTISLSSNGSLIWTAANQTFVIDGPTLQGKEENNAALVYIADNSAGELRAGEIKGNTNSNTGGGVYVYGSNAFFTMEGGTVSDNTASSGGGVYGGNGTVTMEGGTISGNTATSTSGGGGGGVSSNGIFTMEGGTISENTANTGGGVYISNGTVTMKDGTISKNTSTRSNSGAGGGGVCVLSNGIFTMQGGTIGENTATINGGGVCVWQSGTFTITGGTISGNTATQTNNSNGVLVVSNGTFNENGGTVSDSVAKW
jgi:putative ubiquitin-RnfH superfamily antitoxin RatB of RatAB toxin-antitoxin module